MSWDYLLILTVGYLFCFIVGSLIVRWSIKTVNPNFIEQLGKPVIDTGLIIGLCESFITITFILMDAITGLALVFAAKSIARSKKIEEKAEFYLLGTVVNFSFSVFVGIILRYILEQS